MPQYDVSGYGIPSIVLGNLGQKRDGRIESYPQSMIVGGSGPEVDEWPKILQFVFAELSAITFFKIEILSYEAASDFGRNAFGPFEKIGLAQKLFQLACVQFVESDEIE